MIYTIPLAVERFATLLSATALPASLSIGKTTLKVRKGVEGHIQYNKVAAGEPGHDLLQNTHEYTFTLGHTSIQLSLQLYRNETNHYRLFCFTRVGAVQGLVFSLNLTTQAENNTIIHLRQQLRFTERLPGSKEEGQRIRRHKQEELCAHLRELGFTVENTTLELGMFDAKAGRILDQSPEGFLTDLLTVALLKGHYQGNKGYALDLV